MSKPMFEYRKPVLPYICSTPLDFVEERKYLSKVVFPQLNKICKARGSYFKPTDLQWEHGESKLQKGFFLKAKLDAVDRCSPFFLGLLGETYGVYREEIKEPSNLLEHNSEALNDLHWLDKNILMAASGGYQWVLEKDNQFSSFTDIEVTYGTMEYENHHVTMYYRTSDHLDDKLQKADLSEREKIICLYSSESESAKKKIYKLRQRLVNKGVPVKYFRTCEELAELVLEDWMQVIDIILPPLTHDEKILETRHYKEWLAQKGFMNNCLVNFISSPDIMQVIQQLTDIALKSEAKLCKDINTINHGDPFQNLKSFHDQPWNPNVILLVGERGVGKSTLTALWLKKFKCEESHICVISHFVSASSQSSSIRYFMKKCIKILRSFFLHADSSSKVCEELESEGIYSNFFFLCESFTSALALGHCVILLDGIDELKSDLHLSAPQVKKCCWLPKNLPSTCTIVVTTTPSDISYDCLSQRNDVLIIKCPECLTDVKTTLQMLKQRVPKINKLLGGDKEVERLSNLKVMQTPLGSNLVASEVSHHRTYSNLSAFLENFAELSSVRTFWHACVQNWIQDISWNISKPSIDVMMVDKKFETQGWVIDSFSLLAASRNGLTESQILSLLKMIGYRDNYEVTPYDWLQFRALAASTLTELADGRLIFSHQCLREEAEYKFFSIIPHMAESSESAFKPHASSKSLPYHSILAEYFSQQPLDIQVIEELPWLYMKSGNLSGLLKTLTDFRFLFKVMCCDSDLFEEDFYLYWSVCQKNGVLAGSEYIQFIKDLWNKNINNLSDNLSGQPGETLENFDNAVPVLAVDSYTYHQNINSNNSLAASLSLCIIRFLQNFDCTFNPNKILTLLIQFIKQCVNISCELHILLCQCFFMIGRIFEISRDFELADSNYKLAQQALTEADNTDIDTHYQSSIHYLKALLLCCQSKIHIARHKLQTAEEFLLEAEQSLNEEPSSYVLKSTVLFNLALLRATLLEYKKSELLFKESAKLRIIWFGEKHYLVGNVLTSLAILLSNPGNVQGRNVEIAESLFCKTLSIFEKCFGQRHLIVSGVLYYLGLLLRENKNNQVQMEGQRLLQKSLDINLMGIGSKEFDFTAHMSRDRLTTVAPGEFDVSYALFSDRKFVCKSDKLRLPVVDMFRLGSGSNVDGALRWNILGSARSTGRENLRPTGKSAQISKSWSDHRAVGAASQRLFKRQCDNRTTTSCRLNLKTSDQSWDRNTTQRVMFPEIDSLYEDNVGDEADDLPRHRHVISVNLMQDEEVDDSDDDMEGRDVPLVVRGDLLEDTLSMKKTVRIRSANAPKRLYEKFCHSNVHMMPFGRRNMWSGLSKGTSISSSWSGSHHNHCIVPGCHDITVSNTKSVVGPHNDLASLLGDALCPRPVMQKVQHRSAWYHIPGRYATPEESYPKKRMQKTEQVKEIEAFISQKAQWYRKTKQMEFQEGQRNMNCK